MKTPGEHPYGSRPKSRFERWEEDRTLCISDYCIYSYACPLSGVRPHFVARRSCSRFQPQEERPVASLSPFAQRLLASYKDKSGKR